MKDPQMIIVLYIYGKPSFGFPEARKVFEHIKEPTSTAYVKYQKCSSDTTI